MEIQLLYFLYVLVVHNSWIPLAEGHVPITCEVGTNSVCSLFSVSCALVNPYLWLAQRNPCLVTHSNRHPLHKFCVWYEYCHMPLHMEALYHPLSPLPFVCRATEISFFLKAGYGGGSHSEKKVFQHLPISKGWHFTYHCVGVYIWAR